MFSTDELQELRQIEDGLRAEDRGFARRLALLQGVLRLAAPGRQVFLLALAAVAVAMLALGPGLKRLVMAVARTALAPDPSTLMVIGAKAQPGWNAAQAPRHDAGSA